MARIMNSIKEYLSWLRGCVDIDYPEEKIELNEEQINTLKNIQELEENYTRKNKDKIVEKVKIDSKAAKLKAEKTMEEEKNVNKEKTDEIEIGD